MAVEIEITEDPDAALKRQEQLNVFAGALERKAQEQVSQRAEIEDRWVADLRQYHGKYDPQTASRLDKKGSKIFVNITRNKANAAEARLMDMLFPTDDRNWGIEPTPVPELVDAAKDTSPVMLPNGEQAHTEQGPVTQGDLARRQMEIAKSCAKAMQDEINDQLTEAGYSQKARDIIHHAVVYGTGVLKGPVVIGKTRRSWQQMDTPEGSLHVMVAEEIRRPTVDIVNPWNFFPDMSARNAGEAEFFFELHPMTKAEVRRLLKNPGFHKEAIRSLLKEEPRESVVYDRAYELKEISGVTGVSWDNRYHLWEYHGPVNKADLEAAGAHIPEEVLADPLIEFDAVVWFCQGHVLKATINPMDTEERPYSVFCWEKDDNAIFGYGVPFLMRNPQKVINAAWRMILDNAGLSTGPQIVVNRGLIAPADGDWTLTPRKLWYATRPDVDLRQAFLTFEVSSHQQELAAIFEAARQLADEETSLPLVAQGEQAGHVTKTLGGMAMLMNNANIVLKKAVKNWDDDVTVPFITRMYNWNMQFNEKETIKGDYNVFARGTSALLVREIQAQNIMQLMGLATSPIFTPYVKLPELFRKTVNLMQIPEGDIVKSEDQIASEQQQAAEAPQQQDPEAMKLQAQQQLKQMELQAEGQLKQMELQSKVAELRVKQFDIETERDLEMAKLAAEQQTTVEQLRAQIGMKEAQITHEKDLMELEAMIKARFGSGL